MWLDFEWDPVKATRNLEKHGVSFEDAKLAFLDPAAVLVDDWVDEHGEQRYHLIGFASSLLLLLVVHSYRTHDDKTSVRIISARKATANEKEIYRASSA